MACLMFSFSKSSMCFLKECIFWRSHFLYKSFAFTDLNLLILSVNKRYSKISMIIDVCFSFQFCQLCFMYFVSRLLGEYEFSIVLYLSVQQTLCFIFCLLSFLGPHPQHMEVPRLGVQSELQLPAYARAMTTPDPSHVCNLHHSSHP